MQIKAHYPGMRLIEFPRADTFAVEAAAQFGLKLEDIGQGIVRAYAESKLAAAFARHCA